MDMLEEMFFSHTDRMTMTFLMFHDCNSLHQGVKDDFQANIVK